MESKTPLAAREANLHMISKVRQRSESCADAAVLQCTLGWATQKSGFPTGVRKHLAQAIPPAGGERGPPGDTN
jgi:hypothetical protein